MNQSIITRIKLLEAQSKQKFDTNESAVKAYKEASNSFKNLPTITIEKEVFDKVDFRLPVGLDLVSFILATVSPTGIYEDHSFVVDYMIGDSNTTITGLFHYNSIGGVMVKTFGATYVKKYTIPIRFIHRIVLSNNKINAPYIFYGLFNTNNAITTKEMTVI